MSNLPLYRSSGIIPQASGAVAAALKLRASEWELPIEETADRLSMFLWDCELRLTSEVSQLRIDLTGPEERLIGNLRDTVTEALEELGLSIQWDRLNVGALAPGLSLMRVRSVKRISPGFIRMRLGGTEAPRFGQGNLHFRLLLSPPDREPVWPRVAQSGRTQWPSGEDALHRPVYTVVAQQQDWLDFDIFRHENSPTCDWAETDPIGQEIAIIGPGGGWCPDADRLWLFGDETAQPAIARMLTLARNEVFAVLSSRREDLNELRTEPRLKRCEDLLAALREYAPSFREGDYIWFAASADQTRAARQYLLAQGLPKKAFTAAAYWK